MTSDREVLNQIMERLPFYQHLTEMEKNEIETQSLFQTYREEDILHDHHAGCLGMVTVISGRTRVTMQSDDGREITIYSMEPGDTDILTASCVIDQITFDSMMVADEETRVLVTPAALVSRIEKQNIYLHSYIYELTAKRFSDAMWAMQQILFLRMDQRTASGLLDEYARTDDVHIHLTQEKLARQISSSREVVTRILKRMEKDNLLKVNRGCIELLDVDGLEKLLE